MRAAAPLHHWLHLQGAVKRRQQRRLALLHPPLLLHHLGPERHQPLALSA
jgi:hypothetical protein